MEGKGRWEGEQSGEHRGLGEEGERHTRRRRRRLPPSVAARGARRDRGHDAARTPFGPAVRSGLG